MSTLPRPQAPPGLVVGGYTLLTRLGEGGMGVVHLARGPGGERVALKVLRPHIVGDDEARARLAREVSSLSRIRSPWVAEIVDSDPWGEIPFVATRYVPGFSLHDLVQEEGPVTGADLIWLARGLVEGVASVHAAGVLHRDVKPSNVLMEGRTPILIDFGLARVADDPRITHTGWLLGTPGYLPPEILYGEDATPASDVHSWAATVAYAGTGRSPYGTGPSMAIMDRVRRGDHDLTGLPDALRARRGVGARPRAGPPAQPRPRPRAAEPRRRGPHRQPRGAAPRSPRTCSRCRWPSPPRPAWRRSRRCGRPASSPGRPPRGCCPTTPTSPTRPTCRSRAGSARRWRPARPVPERARRAALLVATGVAVAAGITAYPYLATALVLALVWLLRSGSLTAQATGDRQRLRGRARWWDVVVAPLSAPVHLDPRDPRHVHAGVLGRRPRRGRGAAVLRGVGHRRDHALRQRAAARRRPSTSARAAPGSGDRCRGWSTRWPAARARGWWPCSSRSVAAIGLGLVAEAGVSWDPADGQPGADLRLPGR